MHRKLSMKKKFVISSFFIISILIIYFVSVNFTTISIEYSSDNKGAIQLYYDNKSTEGYYFDEAHSERRMIKDANSMVKDTFKVPLSNLRRYRFDFEQVSEVRIEKIEIKSLFISLNKDFPKAIIENYKIINDMEISKQNEQVFLKVGNTDPFIGVERIELYKVYIKIIMISIILSLISIGILVKTGCIDKIISNITLDKHMLIIVMFITLFFIPSIFYNFIIENDLENSENRVLAEKPNLNIKTIGEYPRQYELYFNDHIPFKKDIVKLYGCIKYNFLDMSPVDYVIKGEDDWLFYNSSYKNDGDTLGDYLGKNYYTKEELEQIKISLMDKKMYLKDRGIEFYVMICPNKMSIYEEYMPKIYARQNELTKTDKLVEYLKQNTDLNIIYPKKQLVALKGEHELYYKWDTHWNEKGAYVGFTELIGNIKLGSNTPLLQEQIFISSEYPYGDLINMMGVKPNGVQVKYTNTYLPDISVETMVEQDNILSYKSSNKNGEKLLMFRDSFSTALIPYLNKNFEESTFIWSYQFDKNIIEQEKPDLVVFEVVERNVDVFKN